jgi:hypothetical protein
MVMTHQLGFEPRLVRGHEEIGRESILALFTVIAQRQEHFGVGAAAAQQQTYQAVVLLRLAVAESAADHHVKV